MEEEYRNEIYDEYLRNHKAYVTSAYLWIVENIPEIFENSEQISDVEWQCSYSHDNSKKDDDEYIAYSNYFYGENREDEQVQKDFHMAWLNHIHKNKHHWQHWVLINDEKEEGIKALDMPYNYIIEMICDWWSFSFGMNNKHEIFDWYDKHKDYMILSDKTRESVEYILNKIKNKLKKGE